MSLKIKLLRTYIHFSFLTLCVVSEAQDDSVWTQNPMVSYSGFIDIYYAYDFNKPKTDYRQPFLYNHNRHNEFNVNLGLLKASVSHAKYRANLALQAGTYAIDNYAAESNVMQHVYEANAGVSLNTKNTLWLDAGVFGSHLGFESAVSTENWTLTRSLCAESSPYFLSGAKLTWTPTQNWLISGVVCNGWQRIKRVTGNSFPSFGTQIAYTKNDKLTLNLSTFIGTDDPDATRRMMYFYNFFGKYQVTDKLGVIGGFDYGAREFSKNTNEYYTWYTPTLILRYTFSEKWATALRAEYFHDTDEVIITTRTRNGFQTSGSSLTVDYLPVKNVMLRLEGRWFKSADNVFERSNTQVNDNLFVTSSLAVSF